MSPSVIALIILAIAVIGTLRMAAGGWDRDRIKEHVERQGGRVHSMEWQAFGPGWAGSQNTRIYRVSYADEFGSEHRAYVKTNMFAGVYFTEDTIVDVADPVPPLGDDAGAIEDLLAENQALRAELERLGSRPTERSGPV